MAVGRGRAAVGDGAVTGRAARATSGLAGLVEGALEAGMGRQGQAPRAQGQGRRWLGRPPGKLPVAPTAPWRPITGLAPWAGAARMVALVTAAVTAAVTTAVLTVVMAGATTAVVAAAAGRAQMGTGWGGQEGLRRGPGMAGVGSGTGMGAGGTRVGTGADRRAGMAATVGSWVAPFQGLARVALSCKPLVRKLGR